MRAFPAPNEKDATPRAYRGVASVFWSRLRRELAERIANEIIEDGAATHGLLGASVTSAEAAQGSDTVGALIAEAPAEGGAAANAGLQQGDVVTEFNGVPITDSVDLTAQVRAAAGGSEATITYVRDGETKTVDVTLGTLEP